MKHDRSVDLTRPGLPIDLRIVQGDARTHSITYTLYEGSMRWIIPDGTTAVIHYAKGDGTGGEYDKLPDGTEAIKLNDNNCTVTLAEQVLTWAGCVRLQVTLSNQNGQQLSFWETIIKVLPNVAGQVAKSEDYISVTPSAIASELDDLRVDYAGKRHSKAGDAVREADKSLAGQIDKLKEDLIDIAKVQKILLIDDKLLFSFNGYLNKNGNYQNDSSFVATDYISINDSTSVQIKATTMENLSNVVFFDSEKKVIGKYTGSGDAVANSISVNIPAKAKFVRFSLLKTDAVHILMVYEQIPSRILWLAIGDSITYGYGNNGISYADYAAKKLGISLNKQGVSGSTLSGMYGRVKNGDFDGIKPDIITILGGTNDWNIGKKSKNTDSDTVYTADTYMSYVNCIIETLRAKQPQATIIFLTCLQRDYFGDDDANTRGLTNSNGESLEEYRNVIKTSCEAHAVPVIDLYANSGINAKNYLPESSGYSNPSIKWLTTDGLHPNDTGHKLIAMYVANSLKKFI